MRLSYRFLKNTKILAWPGTTFTRMDRCSSLLWRPWNWSCHIWNMLHWMRWARTLITYQGKSMKISNSTQGNMLVDLYKGVTNLHFFPLKPSNISLWPWGPWIFSMAFGVSFLPHALQQESDISPLIHQSLAIHLWLVLGVFGVWICGLQYCPHCPWVFLIYSFWLMRSSASTSGQEDITELFLIVWGFYTNVFIQMASGFALWPSRYPSLLKEMSHVHNIGKDVWAFYCSLI